MRISKEEFCENVEFIDELISGYKNKGLWELSNDDEPFCPMAIHALSMLYLATTNLPYKNYDLSKTILKENPFNLVGQIFDYHILCICHGFEEAKVQAARIGKDYYKDLLTANDDVFPNSHEEIYNMLCLCELRYVDVFPREILLDDQIVVYNKTREYVLNTFECKPRNSSEYTREWYENEITKH